MSNQRQRRATGMLPPAVQLTTPPLVQPSGRRSPSTPTEQTKRAKHIATPDVRGGQDDAIVAGQLPPMGLLLARPILLLVCMMVGATLGLLVTGNGGYKAEAVIEFTTPGTDNVLVKQTGQTLARAVVASDTVRQAEQDLAQPDGDLASRVSAEWTPDTKLVTVTVTASTEEAAVADANAVANAQVKSNEDSISSRLATAREESNAVLNSQQLDVIDAETARRAQLGSALGARQDTISSQSGDLVVLDPATFATAAGLTKPMGAAIGLVAGLLLGGLASLLLGVRGLRIHSERTLRELLPDAELSAPAHAAQLAGEIIESGKSAVAVVYTEGAIDQGTVLATNVADFLRAHGKTVSLVGPIDENDREGVLGILKHSVREDVPGKVGTDLLVYVVPAGSEAAALLEGQSNLRALVVIRRRRATVAVTLRVMNAFRRAEPVLVLAK